MISPPRTSAGNPIRIAPILPFCLSNFLLSCIFRPASRLILFSLPMRPMHELEPMHRSIFGIMDRCHSAPEHRGTSVAAGIDVEAAEGTAIFAIAAPSHLRSWVTDVVKGLYLRQPLALLQLKNTMRSLSTVLRGSPPCKLDFAAFCFCSWWEGLGRSSGVGWGLL